MHRPQQLLKKPTVQRISSSKGMETAAKPPTHDNARSTVVMKPLLVETTPELKPKLEKPAVVNLDDYHYIDDDDDDDDGLVSAGTTKNNAISVDQYSEDRDLNIAIMASLNFNKDGNFVDLTQDYYCYYDADEDDIKVLDFMPHHVTPSKRQKVPTFKDSLAERGQSSNSKKDPDFVCEICVETMSAINLFSIEGCTHIYCTDCMVKYVASKLQENITTIGCPVPACKGLLEPEYCRPILPKEVFDRWGDALCEAMILGSQKFYCPYKDCSVMLIDDGETIRESECPNCRRMFCAQCKVPWHSEISCEEFKKLHKNEREREDIMLMNLAKDKKWRRCPKCKIFVERTEGCKFMRCRCGNHFCYSCGSTDLNKQNHYCNQCKGIW